MKGVGRGKKWKERRAGVGGWGRKRLGGEENIGPFRAKKRRKGKEKKC